MCDTVCQTSINEISLVELEKAPCCCHEPILTEKQEMLGNDDSLQGKESLWFQRIMSIIEEGGDDVRVTLVKEVIDISIATSNDTRSRPGEEQADFSPADEERVELRCEILGNGPVALRTQSEVIGQERMGKTGEYIGG